MVNPTITPHQLNMYTEPLGGIYRYLETDIFMTIAKRLKTSSDFGKDNVLQWQIERMQELRILNAETIKKLSKTTGMAEKEIRKIITDVGYETVESVDHELNTVFQRLDKPTNLDNVLESYVNQTFRELDNYVNQTLITTNYGQGTVSRMYQRIVEETTAKVLAGQTTINKAVAETVIKWSKKGIDTAFVDRGGHTWQLERYADTVIRSTTNRTYNELRLSRMDEYGVDLVLVSSLPDAREACSKIQGKVATMNEVGTDKYPSIYDFGYGEPDGIRGINCRHILYPFVEGLNVNNEIQYDPEEAQARGKLQQEQRRLERGVRESKRALKVAEELGDSEAIVKYKNQLRNRQAKVREHTANHDLPRRYDKERVITSTQSNFTRQIESDIEQSRIRRETEAKKGNLTDNEQRAINQYISSDSYKVNDKLRRNVPLNESDKQLMNDLDAALKKMPNYDGDLTRSLHFSNNEQLKHALNDYQVGSVKKFNEYLSTTKGDIYNPDGQVQFYILNSKRGKNVSRFNPKEDEIIYERDSEFKVEAVEQINGTHHILLEEYDG